MAPKAIFWRVFIKPPKFLIKVKSIKFSDKSLLIKNFLGAQIFGAIFPPYKIFPLKILSIKIFDAIKIWDGKIFTKIFGAIFWHFFVKLPKFLIKDKSIKFSDNFLLIKNFFSGPNS